MRTHAIRETVSRRGFQNEASMRISFADTNENEPPQGSENGVTLDGKVSMVMPFFCDFVKKGKCDKNNHRASENMDQM